MFVLENEIVHSKAVDRSPKHKKAVSAFVKPDSRFYLIPLRYFEYDYFKSGLPIKLFKNSKTQTKITYMFTKQYIK